MKESITDFDSVIERADEIQYSGAFAVVLAYIADKGDDETLLEIQGELNSAMHDKLAKFSLLAARAEDRHWSDMALRHDHDSDHFHANYN